MNIKHTPILCDGCSNPFNSNDPFRSYAMAYYAQKHHPHLLLCGLCEADWLRYNKKDDKIEKNVDYIPGYDDGETPKGEINYGR